MTNISDDPDRREVLRQRCRSYYYKNREAQLERLRQWRTNNPEKFKACQRAWRKANPEKTQARNAAQRARKKNAAGSINATEMALHRAKYGKACAGCRKKGRTTIDHIVSLAKGGAHILSNIQFLCSPCNSSKKDRDPLDFARRSGRLL